MNLRGKKILITGGGSGIGLEAAKQFLAQGCDVIITGRNKVKLDDAKKEHPALITILHDVANAEDALSLFNKVVTIGGIDILYNNAGVGAAPLNLGIADDRHLQAAAYEMNVNYLGVIRLNNLFLDMLSSRKESAIINTTSILSYVPSVLEGTYSASKTALAFYTKVLREHLSVLHTTVKVFELVPPLVDTAMTAAREGKKISTEMLVKGLIVGLEKDQYTIRIGDSKSLYRLNRFFPAFAFGLINPQKAYQLLRPASA